MTNPYWPIYRSLERVVEDLAFSIHINDDQLSVYSSRIADVILRAATEIESLAKELYQRTSKNKELNVAFDSVALKYLITKWALREKVVTISSTLCFQTKREIFPFIKNERRSGASNERMTFSWNNAYQNLKHNRVTAMPYGNIRYAFEIMAALFVLNIYYKNEKFDLGKDSKGISFPLNLGSSLFSVSVSAYAGTKNTGERVATNDIASCIYYIDSTPESNERFRAYCEAFSKAGDTVLAKSPKFIEWLKKHDVSEYEGTNLAYDILGHDEYTRVLKKTANIVTAKPGDAEYCAYLNTTGIAG